MTLAQIYASRFKSLGLEWIQHTANRRVVKRLRRKTGKVPIAALSPNPYDATCTIFAVPHGFRICMKKVDQFHRGALPSAYARATRILVDRIEAQIERARKSLAS